MIMSANAGKRERRRLKRQQKKRQYRRVQSGSPYRRAGSSGELSACYINSNWRENGQAAIYCVRSLTDGTCAIACFLIDLWCMGLKDAWGRVDISTRELNDEILPQVRQDFELIRVKPEVIQRLVAGGIRFARDNGFRLPKRYQRWTALLGDIGDSQTADLSEFGVDGKLRYFGTMEDLRKRLIGCTVEQFLQREDVEFCMGDDDFSLLDDEEIAFEEACEEMKQRGLDAVRQWCFANGFQPHSKLPEAWDIAMEALLQTEIEGSDAVMNDEECERAADKMAQLMSLHDPSTMDYLYGAIMQLGQFMAQFESMEELYQTLGIKKACDPFT